MICQAHRTNGTRSVAIHPIRIGSTTATAHLAVYLDLSFPFLWVLQQRQPLNTKLKAIPVRTVLQQELKTTKTNEN